VGHMSPAVLLMDYRWTTDELLRSGLQVGTHIAKAIIYRLTFCDFSFVGNVIVILL